MKITSLLIKNFRGIKCVALGDLTGTTILTGLNGAGKTTILDALRVLFVGHCYDATGKRISNDALIGDGPGNTAAIEADVEIRDKAFILRLVMKRGKTFQLYATDATAHDVFLGANTATKVRESLHDLMGVNPRHLECALNPRVYLLGPELGHLLAKLCGGIPKTLDIRNAASEHWKYLKQFADNSALEIDGDTIIKLGDIAFKRRTAVKKDIAVAEKLIEELTGIEQPTTKDGRPMNPGDMSAVKDALKGLQVQRDTLLAEKGVVEAQGKVDPGRIEVLEDEIETLSKKRKALAKEMENRADAVRDLDAARIAEAKIREEFNTIDSRYKSALADVKKCEADSNSFSDKCPTCAKKLPKGVLDQITVDLTHALDCANLAAANALKARNKYAGLVEIEKAEVAAKTKKVASLRPLEIITSELDTVSEQDRVKRAELATLPPIQDCRSLEAVESDIAAINERCATGAKKVSALEKWADITGAKFNLAEYQAELSSLEWMIRAFRDGEFMKSRLSKNKGRFESVCNDRLAPYGYALSVYVDRKNVGVCLKKDDNKDVPLAECSKAELVLAGWAVASSFAVDSSPICMDDLDAMAGVTKNRFLSELKSMKGENPIFIAGAWSQDNRNIAPIQKHFAPATVAWIEGGKAKT